MKKFDVPCMVVSIRPIREFQLYTNNRSNSYVEDGVLYLQPTLTADTIGEENVSQQT